MRGVVGAASILGSHAEGTVSPLDAALRVFQRARGSAVSCFKQAIEVYDHERSLQFRCEQNKDLQLIILQDDDGTDTGLAVVGFKNLAEIELFIAERLNAPRT